MKRQLAACLGFAVAARFTFQAIWWCKSQRPHTSLAGHPREHLYFRCYEGSKGPCYLVAGSADDFRVLFVISWGLEEAGCFQCTKEVHLNRWSYWLGNYLPWDCWLFYFQCTGKTITFSFHIHFIFSRAKPWKQGLQSAAKPVHLYSIREILGCPKYTNPQAWVCISPCKCLDVKFSFLAYRNRPNIMAAEKHLNLINPIYLLWVVVVQTPWVYSKGNKAQKTWMP